MREDTSTRPDMVGEVRFKVPLVFVIPLAALALIALVAITFSRVLLSLPKEAATAVAIVTAANVLIACAFLAARRVQRVGVLEVVLIALYPILIGVVLAQTSFGQEAEHEAQAESASSGEEAASGGATGSALTAQSLQFDSDTIDVTAGEPTDFSLVNEDSQVHNIAIYASEEEATGGGEALFTSPDAPTGSEESFTIEPLNKGEYYFHCDYHPQMAGTVIAK